MPSLPAEPVGPRQPCPCGSGRRYKACHGRTDAVAFVPRPFAGLVGECDWVALREFAPSATAPLALVRDSSAADRAVTAASLLPLLWPAFVAMDETRWLGVQVQHGSGDASRDLAHALELVLAAAAPGPVGITEPPGPGARLQELVDPDAEFVVTVHTGFEFWLDIVQNDAAAMAAAVQHANAALKPTVRLEGRAAAYWSTGADREYLRWVLPGDEDPTLDALARLHAAGEDTLGGGTRLVGSLRAHGLLVPVWELPIGTGAAALEQPVRAFAERLDEVLTDGSSLSTEQRSARAGLANRQLTLR